MDRTLKTGTRLQEKYEITGVLGEGAMSVVYRATDQTGSPRAIKEMFKIPQEDDDYRDSLAMFTREAHFLQTLNHPGLTRIFDTFETERGHYLVMELIEGQSLHHAFFSRKIPGSPADPPPFTSEEVIPWAVQLLDILQYLHGQTPPVIFRDLKPSNIMLTPDGTIKLIDFGIARIVSPVKRRDTYIMGTPGFSAPEQYGTKQSNHRTDMYAFGATMFFLLSGKDPESFAFNFPPLITLNPAVPQWLSLAIARCLNRDPEKRFPSASLMKSHIMQQGQDLAGAAASAQAGTPVTPGSSAAPLSSPWFPAARCYRVDYRKWAMALLLLLLSDIMAFCGIDALCRVAGLIMLFYYTVIAALSLFEARRRQEMLHVSTMAVIIAISLIAGAFHIVHPIPSMVMLEKVKATGKMKGCESNLKTIATCIEMYFEDNQHLYPSSISQITCPGGPRICPCRWNRHLYCRLSGIRGSKRIYHHVHRIPSLRSAWTEQNSAARLSSVRFDNRPHRAETIGTCREVRTVYQVRLVNQENI